MADDLVGAVRASADRLGIDPSDLLTVMSYESGGTFNPNLWGGKDKNYLGIMQFGPEERAKYGVKPGQTAAEQVGAAESFLRDRGLKPGMGLLDIYSTINAGRPGLYNRSDAANGGAPGTVADKVATMAGHRVRANAMLGVGSPVFDRTASASAPVAMSGGAPMSLSPGMGGADQGATAAGEPSAGGDDQFAAILKGLSAIPSGIDQEQGAAMPAHMALNPAPAIPAMRAPAAIEMPAIRYFRPHARRA